MLQYAIMPIGRPLQEAVWEAFQCLPPGAILCVMQVSSYSFNLSSGATSVYDEASCASFIVVAGAPNLGLQAL